MDKQQWQNTNASLDVVRGSFIPLNVNLVNRTLCVEFRYLFKVVHPVWFSRLNSDRKSVCFRPLRTRPLQNAKVMAREKQGEAAEKVMSMGKIN